MLERAFTSEAVREALEILRYEFPLALWETVYVTLLSTAFAIVLGLPLGVLLAVGRRDGILPLPGWLRQGLNLLINLLRSVPFLILMVLLIPLTRAIVGTPVGTVASIAQSMGASPLQIIWKVMLPESVPSLLSNGTIAITTILGYSAMSGIIGGGGLGKIAINYGYHRYQYLVMLLAVALLILLVQIFQALGTRLVARLDRRLK